MANYKIKISYDGTKYKGWQIQKKTEDTIQGKLTHVLSTLVGGPVEVIGSGRTDAGVHAIEQVANFHIDGDFSREEILNWLNSHLPMDIAVNSIEEVDERFHSRYNAVSKTYIYRINTGLIPKVFERKYMYQYDQALDVEAMKQAAGLLLGTHDFKSFCGNSKFKKSSVRTINSIEIEQEGSEIRIRYNGDGFLQNMVRILTGTLIEVGSHRRAPESMTEIIEAGDRKLAGYTAPAWGLTLEKVYYQ